jgi:hypothetical protein
MVDIWRDFWIRETGMGQQVAQLHDRYMMMIMIVFGCCVCVEYTANDKLAQQQDIAQCPINVLMFLHLKIATDFFF